MVEKRASEQWSTMWENKSINGEQKRVDDVTRDGWECHGPKAPIRLGRKLLPCYMLPGRSIRGLGSSLPPPGRTSHLEAAAKLGGRSQV